MFPIFVKIQKSSSQTTMLLLFLKYTGKLVLLFCHLYHSSFFHLSFARLIYIFFRSQIALTGSNHGNIAFLPSGNGCHPKKEQKHYFTFFCNVFLQSCDQIFPSLPFEKTCKESKCAIIKSISRKLKKNLWRQTYVKDKIPINSILPDFKADILTWNGIWSSSELFPGKRIQTQRSLIISHILWRFLFNCIRRARGVYSSPKLSFFIYHYLDARVFYGRKCQFRAKFGCFWAKNLSFFYKMDPVFYKIC